MSYASAAHHEPAELVFLGADDLLNVVHFQAASASKANGPWNSCALDVITGEIHCTCLGFQTGRECWHATLVAAAWAAHPARVLASRYTDAQLLTAGTKAARMVRVYRRRTWRVLPDDQIALVACRQEWFRRQAERAAAGGFFNLYCHSCDRSFTSHLSDTRECPACAAQASPAA
jgi:hypothetical protein